MRSFIATLLKVFEPEGTLEGARVTAPPAVRVRHASSGLKRCKDSTAPAAATTPGR